MPSRQTLPDFLTEFAAIPKRSPRRNGSGSGSPGQWLTAVARYSEAHAASLCAESATVIDEPRFRQSTLLK
jgi:hypothetical protein